MKDYAEVVTLMVWPYFVWSWGISYGLMVFGKILWFQVKIAELNNFRIVIMPRGCFYCLIYYFYLICPMKLTWWVWGLFKWRFRNICIYYQIVTLWYTRHDNKSAFFFSSSVNIFMLSLFFRSRLGTSDSLGILFSEESFYGFSQFVMWAFLGKKCHLYSTPYTGEQNLTCI